jgi:hypothetical protein
VRTFLIAAVALLAASGAFAARPEPRLLNTVRPLPTALDPAFQFRKTKLFHMTEQDPTLPQDKNASNDPMSQATGKSKQKSTSAVQDASITFERQYRLFGAVTKLDQRARFGDYFDFFWRAKRSAAITVRLEYRQEKLHAHVQAQEVFLGAVNGNQKTSFKVVGDDYFDNGRVLAWRCLLIDNGVIVAQNSSYLWR